MSKLNKDHLTIVLELINNSPYFKLLGMKVKEIGVGYCLMDVNLQEKHLNPFGNIHGGVYSSIIDTITYWAVYCSMKSNIGWVTIDLNINNLAPANNGNLSAKGEIIKTGRKICLAEGCISMENGRLLAHGTSKMLVLKESQTIKQIKSYLGFEKLDLPPKFV
ncbi:MAG: hotdog fold thioesterase [Candidatus Lokiarchaeota archaeon]|nr:hotdog fold thioesterase [Candidatus Lokiarchaeota archaeon]MBD3338951.1 hotdog fold thioesterase [Candidatus Lokiarchaeota archaeon]